MLEVHPSDERDSSWEVSDPRFRVYFFGSGGDSVSSETRDLTGCDVLQAAGWAAANANGRRFSIALVDDPPDVRPQGRGLRWILGIDANDSPSTAWSTEALARMERGYP